jgi:hypothetical protein
MNITIDTNTKHISLSQLTFDEVFKTVDLIKQIDPENWNKYIVNNISGWHLHSSTGITTAPAKYSYTTSTGTKIHM